MQEVKRVGKMVTVVWPKGDGWSVGFMSVDKNCYCIADRIATKIEAERYRDRFVKQIQDGESFMCYLV